MDLLQAYSSDKESDRDAPPSSEPTAKPQLLRKSVVAAPPVEAIVEYQRRPVVGSSGSLEITRNLTLQEMSAPVLGPTNPRRPYLPTTAGSRSVITGHVEDYHVEHHSFHEEYHAFVNTGAAANPSGIGHVRRNEGLVPRMPAKKLPPPPPRVAGEVPADVREAHERAMRFDVRDEELGDMDGGIWAPVRYPAEEAKVSDMDRGTLTTEQEKHRKEWLESRKKPAGEEEDTLVEGEEGAGGRRGRPAHLEGVPATETKTSFHGAEAVDYQGRPWTHPPSELRPSDGSHKAFIPKRVIHTYSGHTKGVHSIQFFPRYGHLLLSGSMDCKVKIWDVYNDRRCMRTYMGHSAAVREVSFSNSGERFLSTSFDRSIKLWDTESGKCLGNFSNGKMPFSSRFYPRDEHIFLVGVQNKKIVQFDTRTGDIVQEYDHHLAAVNTVTFVDEGRRFVTTSDDKKILVWEYNIPVPIKYISEPSMHAIPSVAVHPSGHYFVGQSMDNSIVTYSVRDNFRQARKKTFKGHITSGFACRIDFSPNGQFMVSGDGQGTAWFWDWKSCRVYRKLHAHDNGPCIGSAWHPIEPSRLATCGWDGQIKLWD